jgi:Protein of unknown function (DUF3105)
VREASVPEPAPEDPPQPAAPTAAPRPSHSRVRRLGSIVLTVVVALAGVVAVLLVLESRDKSQVDNSQVVPGQRFADQGHGLLASPQHASSYNSDPPTSGAHAAVPIRRDGEVLGNDQILTTLALGNVVLLYGGKQPPAGLRALADDVAGPFDPALVDSGQAIVLGRRPGVPGVIALAWRHLLRVRSASDPALRAFATALLGQPAH